MTLKDANIDQPDTDALVSGRHPRVLLGKQRRADHRAAIIVDSVRTARSYLSSLGRGLGRVLTAGLGRVLTAPLEGVRVVDPGQMITRPLAARLPADMDASVIEIENPEGGDLFRAFRGGRYGASFISCNRKKAQPYAQPGRGRGRLGRRGKRYIGSITYF